MNYIKEINAFYIEIETNSLSAGAGMLWHTLLHMNNRTRWAEEFSVAAVVLCYKSGLPSSTFRRARMELREKGFITFTSRGSKAPIYRMVSLARKMETSQYQNLDQEVSRVEELVEQVDQGVDQVVSGHVSQEVDQVVSGVASTLYKQKEIKQNKKKQTTSNLHLFYTKNFGKPTVHIKKELMTWSEQVGEELIYEAMKRGIESEKLSWNYVKGILKNWQKDGLKTVSDVISAEERYRTNRSARSFPRSHTEGRGEVVPAWFKEMKERERREQNRAVR